MSESEWNRLVNRQWGSLENLVPTKQEAITGAKRLYRHIMGRPFHGDVKITSGNRYTWVRGNVMSVNPDKPHGHVSGGWPSIIHLLAHWCHHRKNPNARPHDNRELTIERHMTEYAIANGFHLGKLKSKTKEKAPVDVVQERYLTMLKRKRAWQTKVKRANNALKKVDREIRQYESRHGKRLG